MTSIKFEISILDRNTRFCYGRFFVRTWSCDFVALGDNSNKFVNSDEVSCELDDFVVRGDSSKFGAQDNSICKQCLNSVHSC